MSKATQQRDAIVKNILEEMEKGVSPWKHPFIANFGFPLRSNGEPYRGMNVLILWDAARRNGLTSQNWFTYKQAQAIGAQVRKGEKSQPVFYYGTAITYDADNDTEKTFSYLKTFRVFNACQIDGLPAQFQPRNKERNETPSERAIALRSHLEQSSAVVDHINTAQAYYSYTEDKIGLARRDLFRNDELHATTWAHELIHWTRHKSRLDRGKGVVKFGSKPYAFEELVAEIGAAMLSARFGLLSDHIEDHSAYLQSWLKALKDDKSQLFKAAAKAQAAVDFIDSDITKACPNLKAAA